MDPTTNTPTPNETPAPAMPETPVAPEGPVAPETPAAPAAPAAPAVNPDVANAALNPPVNPVVAPTAPTAPGAPATPAAPAAPTAPGAATMSMNQMFQSQPANQAGVLDDTTPIAVPEGPKPVDPVEEELKAPLKAAAPVPGSIGSAVSGPQDANAPQNVAFNDPANNPMTADAAPQAKKGSIFDKLTAKTKMSKNTLILLAVVAGIVVVGLIAVLVMVATGMI